MSDQANHTKAIARWRAGLSATGALSESDLDELESHLHDHLEDLEARGITGDEALQTAMSGLGETRSLADEFAKVNPLLAWRAALFWIAAGVLIALGGRPIQELAEHATLASCMALHLGKVPVTLAMWAVSFASPLVFFAALFPLARRHVDAPLRWAGSRLFRVGVVVGCAVTMLASHLLATWGWLSWLEHKRWGAAALHDAFAASDNASYALAVAAPLFLIGLAVRHRAIAVREQDAVAPLFWLAVGLFIASVRWELHLFVRSAVLATGGIAKLQAAQMNALMWIVSLACPAMLFASTYAYLRHRAPGPSQTLRAPFVLAAMGGSAAVAIAAVFATNPLASSSSHAGMSLEVASAGYQAWLLAGIVTSCALPVIVGTIMWRSRPTCSTPRS